MLTQCHTWTCKHKAWFIFNIFPKKLIPAGVEDLGFHIKVRAVQGHSSLPRNYDPAALGELLDIKMVTSFTPPPM